MRPIALCSTVLASLVLVLTGTPAMTADRMQPIQMLALSWTYSPTHPSMQTDLLAISSPIRYRLRVDKGAKCELVLGFVERYWQESGKRVMDVDAEGSGINTVDVVKSVGHRMPYATAVACYDANNDGWLSIEVRMHPGMVDPNPLLNALWLFDRDYWTANGITSKDVLSAKYDKQALYLIDAGTDGSDLIEHDCTVEYQRAEACLRGIRTVLTTHRELGKQFGPRVDGVVKDIATIGTGSIAHGKTVLNHMVDLKEAMRKGVIDAYSPRYHGAIETRLFSPWGSLVRVRHEEKLNVTMDLSPMPKSDQFRYHAPSARCSIPGWISILPETPVSRLSDDLGYGCNLDLKDARYDPLRTVYSYGRGSVAVRVLRTSALGISGSGVGLRVRFNRENLHKDGGLWYGILNNGVGDDSRQVYYGVVCDNGGSRELGSDVELICRNAALVWADSLKELRSVAAKLSDWPSAVKQADRWAEGVSSQLALTGAAPYPAMMDINRRVMASMQYLSGPMFAALDGGYTCIWVRDTTSAVVHAALAGDPSYLRTWAPYLLKNPSTETANGKDHTVFWAFPTMNVEKQQDGQFYAVRSAYSYWKLTGDASRLREWYPVLKSAMEYQRMNYFNEKLGLYCEININEAALKEAGEWAMGEQFPTLKIDGIWPIRSFDLYINHLMYGTHLMLAEIAKALDESRDYARNMRLARELAGSIDRKLWDGKTGHYTCGLALLEDGRLVPFDWNYWDTFFDYAWAVTLYPMLPDPEKSLMSINAMMHERKQGDLPGGVTFAASYAHESYLYSAAGYTDEAEKYLAVPTNASRGCGWNSEMQAEYLVPGSIVETVTSPQLHRPQTFAAGPWMHAVTARCAYIDGNGITVVPGGVITGARGIRYRDAVVNIDTGGVKSAGGISVDGKPLPGTLRIPIGLLSPGKHQVRLIRESVKPGITLAHTDFELRDLTASDSSVTYTLYGYGCGVLRIEGEYTTAQVVDASGKPVECRRWSDKGGSRVQVDASGLFRVTLCR